MNMQIRDVSFSENSRRLKLVNRRRENVFGDDEYEFEKKFIFKELDSKDEIKQMFALRYLVYRYVNFLEPNNYKLDIDSFDFYSTFLGAFELSGDSKKLIGSIRVISTREKSGYIDIINEIVDESTSLDPDTLVHREELLPIMKTYTIPQEYLGDADNSESKDNKLAPHPFELSRLAVLPEFWGAAVRIETGLHDLIILDSWKTNPIKDRYLIATHPRTKRKYQSLGFTIIPGTKQRLYKDINQLAIAMSLNLQDYLNSPNPFDKRCKFLLPRYLETNSFEK